MWAKKLLGLAAGCAASIFCAASASADTIQGQLGAAANYAVLGMGGTTGFHGQIEVYQSGTVVNGNVGAGPYADWTHGMDATINGRIDYDLTDSAPGVTGTVTGGLHQVNMAGAVADALTASTNFAALSPTQTFSTLSEDQIIVGTGGVNVIRVTGDVTLKKTLTLQGSASDSFIFQLTAADATSATTLTLSGVVMTLTGGVTASNVLWDLNGVGGSVAISSSAVVDGYFLAPKRDFLVDNATVLGSVIGGGGTDSHSNSMSVHSSSQITLPPPVGTPLPPAAMGTSVLLAGVGASTLLRRRSFH